MYKAVLEGLAIKGDLEKNKIDRYMGLLKGVEILIEIYSKRMEGAAIKAGIEKTKIDSERVLIDMYLGQVQAKEAEYRMYGEAVRGETAKLEIYKVSTESFWRKVEAVKVAAQIEEHKATANAENVRAAVELYNSQMRGFEAKLQNSIAKINANTEEYRSDLSAYEARIRAAVEAFKLLQNEQNNQTQAFLDIARRKIEKAQLELQTLIAQTNLNMQAASSGGNMMSSALSGALSGINTLAAVQENIDAAPK
jgi:hypothetical protein